MALADAARVAALACDLGYPSNTAQIQARFLSLRDNPDSQVLVAADSDGEIWGWVHVFGHHLIETEGQAEVGGLIVDERARGRGIGRSLMAAAEDWSRKRGYRSLTLRSNTIRTEAHRFYRDLGYEITKSQFKFQKALA
jgi:GNAT superfamily N-acetyltransferase